jgi:hypothetical protein
MVGAGLGGYGRDGTDGCGVPAMLPRSLRCGPQKARASGRDDSAE